MRIATAARQVALFRLLLVVMALAVVVMAIEGRQRQLAPEAVLLARYLIAVVAGLSLVLLAAVRWTTRAWQIVLHLVFDLLWIGILSWVTGGVSSPAIPLFFAVIVLNALALPGIAPFIMPAIAGLIIGVIASLSLARITPLTQAYLEAYPGVADINRIIGQLAIQLAGLFMVDLLGQLLARRLGEQRLYTRELLDQLGEGVIAIDLHGAVAYANDEAVRLLELPSTDLTGLAMTEVLRAENLAPLRQHLASGTNSAIERWQRGDGRQLVARITALQGRTGAPIGRTLLVADETRVRLLEENARRAEHLANLGEMAAGIAHEVRNPLASLRGCAQELAEMSRRGGDEDARALAGIMISEADRLARIVEEFLAFSRLRKADSRDLDIHYLIEEAERLVRLRSDLPIGLNFTVTIEHGLSPVQGDADQIRQVLLNLINNAIDAVRNVSCPQVSCRISNVAELSPLETEAVAIRIRDNGHGIAPEVRERLFTPFFSTKAQGTGLGLALVSRILREHEGTLDITSAPGSGAVFTIYLPVRSVTRQFRRVASSSGIMPLGGDGGSSFPSGAG